MTLLGFWLASRYSGISDFLVPSLVYMAPSQLPALTYFGVWDHWLLYLVPTQPAMVLLAAAFQPLPAWQIVYALGYGLLCCAVVTWMAVRAYERFVVRSG
jgi:fluoroquinolone transport system permease protein